MNNNDYNEQNPNEQPQTYAYNQFQNNYGAAGTDNNGGYAYNNYNYQTNYNGNGGYTNMGGTVIDSNGKALKNHFGIKLTFSILEMLCCCTSCITLIMGIIACVFTCQANTCYKEGRYEEFKSKAKTSTILLIVGAVVAAIAIIINIISLASLDGSSFQDAFMEEYEKALEQELGTDIDMDTFWDDVYEGEYDNLYDESLEGENFYSEYNEMADHPNFDDFNQIVVNGTTISLPCTYADLTAVGLYAEPSDLNDQVEAFDSGYFELHSSKQDHIAGAEVINNSNADTTAENCLVVYLEFFLEDEEEVNVFEGMEFVNGLTFFKNIEETMDLLGEPNSIYMDDTEEGRLEVYCWEYDDIDEYYSFVTVSFYDGVIYSIQINNGPSLY